MGSGAFHRVGEFPAPDLRSQEKVRARVRKVRGLLGNGDLDLFGMFGGSETNRTARSEAQSERAFAVGGIQACKGMPA